MIHSSRLVLGLTTGTDVASPALICSAVLAIAIRHGKDADLVGRQ